MSNFDEKVVDRIKKLEREVERLRVKESPGAWLAWTPTVAWTGGTTDFTTAEVSAASYCKVGKLLLVNIVYQISTVGTGDRTQLTLTLPTGIDISPSSALSGIEAVRQTTLTPVGVRAFSTDDKLYVYFSTAPTLAGYIYITGVCQIA